MTQSAEEQEYKLEEDVLDLNRWLPNSGEWSW